MKVSFHLRDWRVAQKEINAIARKLPDLTEIALRAEGQTILQAAKDLVPIDEGDLYRSGRYSVYRGRPRDDYGRYIPAITTHGTPSNASIHLRVSFGGPGIPQAMAVHEHPSKHSPPSWRVAESQGRPVKFLPAGRGPKFLDRPMRAAMPGMANRIAAHIKSLGG